MVLLMLQLFLDKNQILRFFWWRGTIHFFVFVCLCGKFVLFCGKYVKQKCYNAISSALNPENH